MADVKLKSCDHVQENIRALPSC